MAWIDLKTASLIEDLELSDILAPESNDEQLKKANETTGNNAILGISFEKYRDGRGFSLARALRDEFGFTGKLAASGNLIPDQAQFLLRVGFDYAEIGDAKRLEAWQNTLKRFSLHYQPLVTHKGTNRHLYRQQHIDHLNKKMAATQTLDERLLLLIEANPKRISFSTSLQKEDQAITNAINETGINADIFTLDTQRMFPEVLETLDKTINHYTLPIRKVKPDAKDVETLLARDGLSGIYDSVKQRKDCCHIRKVKPLSEALKGATYWITGLRRAQYEGRSDVPFAQWDEQHHLIKINPVADWSDEHLEAYLSKHHVPLNPMHERGFPSIGCEPCTRAIKEGEDPRAGRWWWENDADNKECGLHVEQKATAIEGQAS